MTQANAGAGDAPGKLFRGYDGIANGMLNESAVTGGSEQSGTRSTVKIRVCESATELAQALEIDASLSVSYLKAANVTGKMHFLKNLNTTARSVSIVVYATHEIGTWTAKDVKLAADIKAPTNDDEAADFAAFYGDSYVSAATQGGEYYAVYTFFTETQAEQRDLTASLKAKGVFSGVTAKLDVQAKLSSFLSETKTSWKLDQEMTGLTSSLPTEDKLIAFALDFPSKTLDAAVPTAFKVSGYEGVPGMARRKFLKIVDNRDHFLGSDGVLQSFARLSEVLNQINWLKQIYAFYNYTGDKKLLDVEKQVKADLAKIDKQVTAYKRDPGADFAKPELPSLATGEPKLSFEIAQPVSFGGEGGGPFPFMPVEDALRGQVRIASIQFADTGDRIDRMKVEYASSNARWMDVKGMGGIEREKFEIPEGTFPSRFEVHHGDTLKRIAVWVPGGRHMIAGRAGGTYADWAVPPGAVVLGFAGRCGSSLDQLKIISATLKPATYA